MTISFRSVLTVGVATVTATAVAFGPSIQEPTPTPPTPVIQIAPPPIKLAAQVQPLAAAELPNLLVGWLERIVVPPSASQPFPTPDFPPVVGGTGIDSTIKNIYNAVEPWVQYGFELATYFVGWIPYVGWLSGQIMIFYNFGERIVRSITFNIADWLGGNVSFVQGLINVGVATVNSFIQLGIDEWNYFLPPLPPLPPFPFAASATEATATTNISDTELATTLDDDAVLDAEVTVKPKKKLDVDVVEATDATTTSSPTTGVAAQGDVRDAPDGEATESTKAPKAGKKSDTSSTADGAAEASADKTSKKEAKGDEKGEKKGDTGKKDDKE